MPKGYRVKGWKFLSEELGILGGNHNYNLSEKSLKTRPLSFLLWAVAYLVDNLKPKMVFEDIAFLLMFSDIKYFEMHIVPKRTGWGTNKCDRVVKKMLTTGYLQRERPKSKRGVYHNEVYDVEYKYYPTTKYSTFIKRLEDEFEAITLEKDITIGEAEDAPREIKDSPNLS